MTEFTKQDFELCARILNVKSYEWIMDNFGEEYLEIYDGKVLFKKFDPLNKLSDAMDLLRAAGFSVWMGGLIVIDAEGQYSISLVYYQAANSLLTFDVWKLKG